MDTDPNPFRESPDSDRSSSSTEAVDDATRDFAEDDENRSGASPLSEDDEDGSAGTGSDGGRSTDETGGVTSPDATRLDTMRQDADERVSGGVTPL